MIPPIEVPIRVNRANPKLVDEFFQVADLIG